MSVKPTPSEGLLIRPATPTDSNVIFGFLCELEDMPLDPVRFQIVFDDNLANPIVHYLVAELAGEVIGFVSCHVQQLLHHVGKVGEIQELFVKADYRNRQIGRRLMAALDTLAVQEDLINLEVTTNQKRADTVRFYERELFTRTHFKLVKPIQP